MFKIDKHTHLIILFTFALVFVVIYLYFTITDVRKMQRDITKLAGDVAALQTGGSQQQPKAPPPATVIQVQHPTPQPEIIPVATEDMQENEEEEEIITVDDEDDDDSVATEDVKAVLTPGEEEEEEISIPPQTEETTNEVVTEQYLQSLKFEEIKDMCRKRGIKIQGTKEALMKRLLESETA